MYSDDTSKARSASRTILEYLVGDVDVLEDMRQSEVMKWSVDLLAEISQRDNIPLQQALYSSRLTHHRQKKDSLRNRNVYEDDEKYMRKGATNRESRAKQRFNRFVVEESDIHAPSGVYENVKLLQINYAKALQEELHSRYPHEKYLFRRLAQEGDKPFRREFLTTILNSSCDPIRVDMTELHENEERISRALKSAGLSSEAKKAFKERLFCYGDEYLKASGLRDAQSIVTQNRGFEMEQSSLEGLLRMMNSYHKRKKRYYAKYGLNMETSRFKISHQLQKTKDILSSYGLKPVHHERSYIYVIGDSDRFEKDHPGRIITSFDNAYIAKEFDKDQDEEIIADTANRLYYNRHGFYKGVTIKDHPSHNLTRFEMETYKGFLENVLSGEYESAVRHLAKQEARMFHDDVPASDLVMMTKRKEDFGRDRYKAFEKGRTIHFYLQGDDAIQSSFDPETERRFEMENLNNKEKPVYIMGADDLNPDWKAYYNRHRTIIYNLAYYTLGRDTLINLLSSARKNDLFVEPVIREATKTLEYKTFH